MNAPLPKLGFRVPPEARRLRMLHANALIRMDEPESITESGIIIPDAAKTQPQFATVVKVGPRRWIPTRKNDQMVKRGSAHREQRSEIRPGDRVLVGAFNGHRVDEHLKIRDGHEWYIVETLQGVGVDWNVYHHGDIYAIVEE